MNDIHNEVLRKNRVTVLDHMDTDRVIEYLLQDSIITRQHYDEVKSERTPRDRAIKLLDLLPTRGPGAFKSLWNAIDKTTRHLAIDLRNHEAYPFLPYNIELPTFQ